MLADALLEAGGEDPRGELITLQHRRGGSSPSKREREIIKKHTDALLGRLSPSVLRKEPIAFELGFAARVAFRNHADGRARIGDPWWSTVEWLDVADGASSPAVVSLLTSEPIRRWLRTAWNVSVKHALAASAAAHPSHLRELGVLVGTDEGSVVGALFEALSGISAELGRVVLVPRRFASRAIDERALEAIFAASVTESLEEVHLHYDTDGAIDELTLRFFRALIESPRREALRSLRVVLGTRAGRVTVHLREPAVDVHLTAGRTDAIARQLTTLLCPKVKRVRLTQGMAFESSSRAVRATVEAAGIVLTS